LSDIEKFERTDEQQDRCIKIHDVSRNELLKRQLSNSENYDKAILSLSSAALALSLIAIKFIIPLNTANQLWAIKLSWIFFLITIIVSLAAFLVSNRAINKQLSIEEDYYIKGIVKAQTEKNIFSSINSVLNNITGIVFIAAISLVIYFVTINLGHGENEMSTKKPSSTTKVFVTDSASVPKMQIAPDSGKKTTTSADIPKMQLAPGNIPAKQTASPPPGGAGSGTADNTKK